MKKIILMCFVSLSVTGCMQEVPMDNSFWQQKKQQKVAVAVVTPVKPRVSFQGQQGILDVAINNAAMKKVNESLSHTDISWYKSMQAAIADQFKKRNVSAVIARNELINDNDNQLLPVSYQSNTNDVLALNLVSVGAVRQYYGFIPLSKPRGFCVLRGELIDATTKKVKWRHTATADIPVQGDWDQPPAYPNLMLATNKAIAQAKNDMMNSLFANH